MNHMAQTIGPGAFEDDDIGGARVVELLAPELLAAAAVVAAKPERSAISDAKECAIDVQESIRTIDIKTHR